MKRPNIKCPYCGSRAFLRPASVIYKSGEEHSGEQFYVCARYPSCDSYVTAHAGTRQPMGTLANRELRMKRRAAHMAFNQLWQRELMSKKEAYRWLQTQMGVDPEDAHIARFSDYRCDETIRLCSHFLEMCRAPGERKEEGRYERAYAVDCGSAESC